MEKCKRRNNEIVFVAKGHKPLAFKKQIKAFALYAELTAVFHHVDEVGTFREGRNCLDFIGNYDRNGKPIVTGFLRTGLFVFDNGVCKLPDDGFKLGGCRIAAVYGDVAVDGDIYVADNGNRRVMLFDSSLKKKAEIGRWEKYRLLYPNGIDRSLDGRLAIADTGNHKVVILDANHKIIQVVGRFGTAPGCFVRPHEARFGPNGDLYVLDTGNARIQVFRGPQIRQFPRCPAPEPPPPPQKLEELLPPPAPPKDSF